MRIFVFFGELEVEVGWWWCEGGGGESENWKVGERLGRSWGEESDSVINQRGLLRRKLTNVRRVFGTDNWQEFSDTDNLISAREKQLPRSDPEHKEALKTATSSRHPPAVT